MEKIVSIDKLIENFDLEVLNAKEGIIKEKIFKANLLFVF